MAPKETTVQHHGREHARHRDRCPHCGLDRAALKPHRLGDDLDAAFFQHLYDADMRITPRTPAAEPKRHAYRLVHGPSVTHTERDALACR